MTEEIFREDAYARTCQAVVTAVDERGIQLDRTVFYPMGGGQPGDTGVLRASDGSEVRIVDTVKDRATGDHLHVPEDGAPTLTVGDQVTAEIDWDRRYRHMRMHTCLHLLCAAVEGDVTGGQVGADKSRLDFNVAAEALDKDVITARLNELVASDRPVRPVWISDEELAAKPELVRTMSVKPPSGAGRVRLLEIEDTDLQPCGGTHVGRTGEIGTVRVSKIENKGKQNRRVNVVFAD